MVRPHGNPCCSRIEYRELLRPRRMAGTGRRSGRCQSRTCAPSTALTTRNRKPGCATRRPQASADRRAGRSTDEATRMPHTVAALFDDEAQAEFAVHALRSARFVSARTQVRRAQPAQMPDIGATALRGLEIGYLVGTAAGAVLGVIAAGLIPRTHVFLHGGVLVPLIPSIPVGVMGRVDGLLRRPVGSPGLGGPFGRE